jgi:bifunctional DNA-binding transcriptional regulator/antitoxin component of YhaV-PrlF toxin-antitoxin module
MHITTKGQVTIPLAVREAAGLLPHTEVEFLFESGKVYLQKVATASRRGKSLVQHMRGQGTVNMSTDEIMKLTRG